MATNSDSSIPKGLPQHELYLYLLEMEMSKNSQALKKDDPEKDANRRVVLNKDVFADDFTVKLLRRKVFEFYATQNAIPTVADCLQMLKKEIEFKGNCTDIVKMLTESDPGCVLDD